jgi:hypothetical protein
MLKKKSRHFRIGDNSITALPPHFVDWRRTAGDTVTSEYHIQVGDSPYVLLLPSTASFQCSNYQGPILKDNEPHVSQNQ